MPHPWDPPVPKERIHADLIEDVPCQASPSKLALLAVAASTVESGEHYLEVGSFTGASTITAARARADLEVIAIDNFSQFGGPKAQFLENLRRYGVHDRVRLIEADYRDALAGTLPPIGVYLFDGPHEYLDQYEGLELGLPHLVDGALVIVDDTRWAHVTRANRDFAAAHPQLSLLCDLPSPSLNHEAWWNGLQVYEFRKDRPAGSRDLAFRVNRARFAITQPMVRLRVKYTLIDPAVRSMCRAASGARRRLSGWSRRQ